MKDNMYRKKVGSSFEKLSRTSIRNLIDFRNWVSTFYGVTLPEIKGIDKSNVKSFCAGLLEKPECHPWWESIKTLNERKRYGIMHSLFLFRKTLPAQSTKEESIETTLRNLCSQPSPVDEDFLKFVKTEIPEILEKGWDNKYGRFCDSFVPGTSSCTENSQRKGGSRMVVSPELRQYVREESDLTPDSRVKMVAVPDGGKYRVVTVHTVDQCVLKPLHETLYDRLSKNEWLLRGDAKPSSFQGFFREHNECFVSGDYESATDNIPFVVYQTMMRSVREQSLYVPQSVWNYAEGQVKHLLSHGGHLYAQEKGQLMGSYLSFPFLCLLNYLVFRYSIGRSTPVLINGDDIVFRARADEIDQWKKNVSNCGFKLSVGKTLVHPRIFTLNSAIFRAKDFKVESIPFIRPSCIYKREQDVTIDTVKGRYSKFLVGGSADKVRLLKSWFLRRFTSVICSYNRSLTRGLGMRVPNSVLRMSGFSKREQFYLRFSSEPPLYQSRSTFKGPDGYRVVKKSEVKPSVWAVLKEKERDTYIKDLVDSCWNPQFLGSRSNREKRRRSDGTVSFFDFERHKCGIRNSKVYLSLKRLYRKVKPPDIRSEETVFSKMKAGRWKIEFLPQGSP